MRRDLWMVPQSSEEDEEERAAVAETVNVGTSLFELYLSLQHMAS